MTFPNPKDWPSEDRINAIVKNGNTGCHYKFSHKPTGTTAALLDETIYLGVERAKETGFKQVGATKFTDFNNDLVVVVNSVEKTRGYEYVYFGRGAHRLPGADTIPKHRIIKL